MSDPLKDPLPPRVPENYDGLSVCAGCYDGWPGCRERKANGKLYAHQDTCKVYRVGERLCIGCDLATEKRYEHPAEQGA